MIRVEYLTSTRRHTLQKSQSIKNSLRIVSKCKLLRYNIIITFDELIQVIRERVKHIIILVFHVPGNEKEHFRVLLKLSTWPLSFSSRVFNLCQFDKDFERVVVEVPKFKIFYCFPFSRVSRNVKCSRTQ